MEKRMGYEITYTEEMGRGLYANRHVRKGEVIAECEILLLDPVDTVAVNKTSLQYYTFHVNETQDCLVLGDAEIYNHSDQPNVHYALVPMANGDGTTRQIMVFTALDDIVPGLQMFIDYNAYIRVNCDQYLNTKSLIGVANG
jgi:SET domain-containing protein